MSRPVGASYRGVFRQLRGLWMWMWLNVKLKIWWSTRNWATSFHHPKIFGIPQNGHFIVRSQSQKCASFEDRLQSPYILRDTPVHRENPVTGPGKKKDVRGSDIDGSLHRTMQDPWWYSSRGVLLIISKIPPNQRGWIYWHQMGRQKIIVFNFQTVSQLSADYTTSVCFYSKKNYFFLILMGTVWDNI